ncbi:MAG TPA: hypothetical protein VFQ22_04060, partial [Longimicrobiales bacterium]|nr:hypothetical protein [Longimicrobiales bacterium]
LRDAGIPTPPWMTGCPSAEDVERRLGLPVIVKAASAGSSLRLVLAHDHAELERAIEESRTWNDVVIFETYVRGRELTVGVLGDQALAVGEIVPEHELFDYECKYQPGKAREIFPAAIRPDLAKRVQRLALRVHAALRLRDYSRIDFMVDTEGVPWCLEANAAPGMTATSLLPQSARSVGIDFPALCERIATLAKSRIAAHST